MVLREVVNDLAGLFGTTAGGAMLRTDIERLSLPGYQRRALVLAASELVINTLSHAFGERRDGWLLVSRRRADGQVRLVVADDGIRCDIGPEQAERGVAGSMAALLEGSLVYRAPKEGGTWAEIGFADPWCERREHSSQLLGTYRAHCQS